MLHEFTNGSFNYESPTLTSGLRLVGRMKKAFPQGEELTESELLAIAIENMEALVTEIKINESESTWNDLLKEKTARVEIIKAADKMIGELFLDEEKKTV